MAKPTFTDLWELLNYEFETGKLWWRPRSQKWFKTFRDWKRWNNRWANTEAFTSCLKTGGYKRGMIFNKPYSAHHVIWMMCYAEWPTKPIDHIDGIRTNNKLTNLRLVSASENSQNTKIRSTNISGVQGVHFHKQHQKWMVKINHNRKPLYLGYYDSFEEAVRVRKQAEIDYGYHPNHGRPGR